MNINLNNGYYITQIPLNTVLMQSRITTGTNGNKSAKPRMIEEVIGYYNDVPSAIEAYVKETIKNKTEDFNGNLEDYCKRINDITENAVVEIRKELNA